MIRWLIRLIVGCNHDWDFIEKYDCYMDETSIRPFGSKWIYKCKKCHKIKFEKDYRL